MSVSIMQYPSDGKLCLQRGGDGKPVSLQKEGKVVPLKFITPVDQKDPHVQYLGNWAVEEHNGLIGPLTGSKLKFVCLTGGYKAETVGTTYYDLRIVAANDEGVCKNYVAVIEEQIILPTVTIILLLFIEKKWRIYEAGSH